MLMERNPSYTPLAAPSTWEFHAQWKAAEGAEIHLMDTRCRNRVVMNLLGTIYLASLGHIFFRDFFVHSLNVASCLKQICKMTKICVFFDFLFAKFFQFFFFLQYNQISLLGSSM